MAQEPDAGEQAYLEEQRKALRESVNFWSSVKKPEREIWVVRTLLQHLDIAHRNTELFPEPSEPPDVNFRDARFEIKEILDPARRRHEEYRKKIEKAMASTSLRELGEEYTPQDLTYQEICDRLFELLEDTSRHYAPRVIEQLDLLVYVNLIHRVIDAGSPIPESSAFLRHGWRSISVVRSSFACVLYARSDAPLFLRSHVGEHVSQPSIE